ncbi:DEAD/DEAH box helicase [Asaia astilbis]|uniref:DEAD/DEAH box helicase n=1 Tax=Asaia astilbis TaxID=610244 RepID=UPI00046FC35A|nr:DEAD/DEAH box helicase [Asaia astilbis]
MRPYQERVSHEVGAILREGVRRVLVQMSTGAGKTVLASHFIERAQATGRRIFFLCHRIELVAGTSGTLERYGISHGVIAAGYAANPEALIQVCSIDTLKTRLGDVPTPWAIIVDETHHCRAAGWEQAISHFVDAGSILIGLTATPKRLDGRGLGAFFDSIVLGPQTADLITSGHLSGFRHFMPDAPDRFLVGDPVAHWQRRAVGLRSVGFAKDTAHSRRIVEQFNAAGVPAAHLDANTPKEERRNTIRAFADGHILVLINVDLFGEGFDLAAVAGRPVTVDCVMFYRRTKSLSLYLQWAGRALRPAPNKTAIVLDHAGNWYLHGDIDAVREWSLGDDTGKIAKPAERAPITCLNASARRVSRTLKRVKLFTRTANAADTPSRSKSGKSSRKLRKASCAKRPVKNAKLREQIRKEKNLKPTAWPISPDWAVSAATKTHTSGRS